MHKISNV